MSTYRFGLIGYGHWGKNLARTVAGHPEATLAIVADAGERGRDAARVAHPTSAIVDSANAIIADASIEAVVITSPAATHVPLALQAIEAGKHVLITKPIASSVAEVRLLKDAAARKNVVVMADHTFLYHPCVAYLRCALGENWLGAPLVYDAIRTGLGIYKVDADIIADLAVHDLAIVDYVFGPPKILSAYSYSAIPGLLPDNVIITAAYEAGLKVHIRSSWLSPLKQRLGVLVGEKQMIVWDDNLGDQRLRAFDVGVERIPEPEAAGRAPLRYRAGETRPLAAPATEPLRAEIDDFVVCMREGKQPISSLDSAARVIAAVDACQKSAASGGIQISFSSESFAI